MADGSTTSVGDQAFAVLQAGEGGRPLLLVHGFTGAKEDFADWIDPLAAEGWWVVAPDLRGHGAGPMPAEEADYSLAIFASDIRTLVDELGWERFALLGHSMGGMIAQDFVLADPGRVSRLILMDTCHGPVEGIDADSVAVGMQILRTDGLLALIELLDALGGERTPSEERVRASRPGYIEFGDRKLRTSSPAMYAAMATELVSRPDRLAELATLRVPTQVVVGVEDVNFVGPSRRMAEAIPGAELVVIPDASHCPQFEHPEAWWAAVAPFLGAGLLVD